MATTAATTYTASAWVRAASASSVGKPIQIKLRERNAAGTVIADVGSANVALSNTWQKLTVTRATAAGNNLGVRPSRRVGGDRLYAFFADGLRPHGGVGAGAEAQELPRAIGRDVP